MLAVELVKEARDDFVFLRGLSRNEPAHELVVRDHFIPGPGQGLYEVFDACFGPAMTVSESLAHFSRGERAVVVLVEADEQDVQSLHLCEILPRGEICQHGPFQDRVLLALGEIGEDLVADSLVVCASDKPRKFQKSLDGRPFVKALLQHGHCERLHLRASKLHLRLERHRVRYNIIHGPAVLCEWASACPHREHHDAKRENVAFGRPQTKLPDLWRHVARRSTGMRLGVERVRQAEIDDHDLGI
mmetsp:Transcript_119239/g.337297  ORF Transcript_119239/g.337297 Transcript_119239/m.337297 type:complete len:245 (+) Transcript_119239:608-1342(+)